jgi:predicted GNAT family acetyltransferase
MPIHAHPASPAACHLTDPPRFEVVVDGETCIAEYRLADGVMAITHTEVPPRVSGRGIAATLTRAALEHARATGLKVRPLCSYARSYMQRHPETLDLLA